MSTRSWGRRMSVLATAICLAGCGGGAASPAVGVLTKGHGGSAGTGEVPGTGGMLAAGGAVGVATGGAGVGGGGTAGAGAGGGAAGGSVVGTDDGGIADVHPGSGGAEGTVDAHGDAPVDGNDPIDAGNEARRDTSAETGGPGDAQGADDGSTDLRLIDAMADATPGDASAHDAGAACPVMTTAWVGPRAARSGGYSGNLTDYSSLYDVVCTSLKQCKDTCMDAGGTADSCMTGSQCATGAGTTARHCLPPTYWRYGDRALEPSEDWTDAAEQTLVVIDYNDPLVIRDFRPGVPAGATIRGIQFEVRRSADADTAIDDSIRILRDGQPVGTDKKDTGAWPMELASAVYGGPNDTWGTTWTPADLEDAGFGIAVAARYTLTAGNARAYVDYVRVRVSFVPAACPANSQ